MPKSDYLPALTISIAIERLEKTVSASQLRVIVETLDGTRIWERHPAGGMTATSYREDGTLAAIISALEEALRQARGELCGDDAHPVADDSPARSKRRRRGLIPALRTLLFGDAHDKADGRVVWLPDGMRFVPSGSEHPASETGNLGRDLPNDRDNAPENQNTGPVDFENRLRADPAFRDAYLDAYCTELGIQRETLSDDLRHWMLTGDAPSQAADPAPHETHPPSGQDREPTPAPSQDRSRAEVPRAVHRADRHFPEQKTRSPEESHHSANPLDTKPEGGA